MTSERAATAGLRGRSIPSVGDEPPGLQHEVPLARFTTLELGGPARHLVEAADVTTVVRALTWASQRGLPVVVLGGGSNVVVADAGFDGVVLRVAIRGRRARRQGGLVRITAGAGEPWAELVADLVGRGWAGVECLAGIPGTVGAAPIQNLGAYGQELAEVIAGVRVIDRRRLSERWLRPEECALSYRSSRFRAEPDRFVVVAVALRLRPGGAATVRYPELEAALAGRERRPTIAEVSSAVLALRSAKSMVLDPGDPNHRSVGSFFVNPVVPAATAHRLAERAGGGEMPRFPAPGGLVKIPAGWLIERCGFARGQTRERVGISSRHSLALVHHGGGSAAELVALAREIRRSVRARFGIELRPEPAFIGFAASDPTAEPDGA